MSQKINLLYAEDNPLTASLVKRQLERENFTVRIAADGSTAWDLFNLLIPDILLLDIEMPEKDGLEVLKLVRKKNRHVPIVIYSTYLNPTRELEAIEEGADDCINKRSSRELLIAKLKNIYNRVTEGEKNPQVYILSPRVKFNSPASVLYIDNKMYELTAPESRLLRLLCVKFQEIASYNYLLMGLWGKGQKHKMQALRKTVFLLNQKLKADPTLVLKADRDTGYFFGRIVTVKEE